MKKSLQTWSADFASVARFDYAKLTFPDVHPAHRRVVDETIRFAFGRLQEEHPRVDLHLPKVTTLDPSPNKPNGKYIVELHGFVAELLQYLPAGWTEYLTYAHVKAFVTQPYGWNFDDLEMILKRRGGYRMHTMREYKRGNRSGTKQAGWVHTLGSGKSGTHLNAYQRPSQPVGLEGKFRDEQVKNITAIAWDIYNTSDGMTDQQCWLMARAMWGRKAANAWAHELYNRNLDPDQLFNPVTYEEWRAGGGRFEMGEGHDKNNLPEQPEIPAYYSEDNEDD